MTSHASAWQTARNSVATYLLASTITSNAFAFTPPDITGTYSGADSYSSVCSNPADNETNTPGTFSLSINDQSGTSFSGIVNSDGDVINLTGTILNENGDFTGSFTGTGESGTVSGTFVPGGTGSISYSGFNSIDSCSFSGTGTITGGTYAPSTAPSTAIATQQVLSTNVTTFTTAITTRITSLRTPARTNAGLKKLGKNGLMMQSYSGMSSGDESGAILGFWGSINHTKSEDDFVSTAFEAKRNTIMVGADMSPRDGIIFGVALGYESNDIDTEFNGGEVDSDGFSFIAYGSQAIDDVFSVDLIAGFSRIDIDQYRTLAETGTRVTSQTDAARRFFSGNINAGTEVDNWLINGRAGILIATEEQDAFLESNGSFISSNEFEIGQIRVGADAAYLLNNEWEPYGSLTLEYDYTKTVVAVAEGSPQPSFDRTGGIAAVGVRYYGKNGVSGNFEYSTVIGRDNYSEGTFTANLRAEF